MQNGQCVRTSKVAWDHTLSKHCHTTRHVGALGEADCWEQGRTPGASTQHRTRFRPSSSASGPGSVRSPWESGCGARAALEGGAGYPNALSMFLKVPPPHSCAVSSHAESRSHLNRRQRAQSCLEGRGCGWETVVGGQSIPILLEEAEAQRGRVMSCDGSRMAWPHLLSCH